MAEEPIQTMPPVEAAKGGGSPWMAIIIIVLLMPALSYVMTQFVLIPQLQAAFKSDAAGEHGEDADAVGAGKGPEQSYELTDIVVNLAGALRTRYIKVGLTLNGHGEKFTSTIEEKKAQIIDITGSILSTLTVADIEEPGVKNVIRNDLLSAYETELGKRYIERIYFSEFIIQ